MTYLDIRCFSFRAERCGRAANKTCEKTRVGADGSLALFPEGYFTL